MGVNVGVEARDFRTPSSPDLHLLDIIARLPIKQVIRVDAGPRGLEWHRHRDRLLAGADAVLLHVEWLAYLLALLGGSAGMDAAAA